MKPFNLSQFKKTAEDKKTVTMTHANGHKIVILKPKLSAIQRKQIEQLPVHMAQGGMNDEEAREDNVPMAAPATDDSVQLPGGGNAYASALGEATKEAPKSSIAVPSDSAGAAYATAYNNDIADKKAPESGSVQPASVEAASASVPQEQPKPAASPSGSGFDANKAYQQGQKAISEQQDIATQLAQKQAQIQEKDITDRQALSESVQQHSKDFQEHQRQLFNDYLQGHINPSHYQENMGTGQKVATAIGLLLGGFQGGFNGSGVNPAAVWLNDQINRDIESQRSELDKKKTLLGANQELYKDQVLADSATRMNLNDIYDHKIQQAATQLGTPAAKAAADAAHSKFALENADLLTKSADRAAFLKGFSSRNSALTASDVVRHIPGLGSPQEAIKEEESIGKQRAAIQNLRGLYSQAQKEINPKELLNPASSSRLGTINAGIRDAILSGDTAHRVNPEIEQKFLAPYLLSTKDFLQGTAPSKLNAALEKTKTFYAGQTPITEKYLPQSLPDYGTVTAQKPQFKVGDTVYVKGQKAQIVSPGGDYKVIQ